jgi:protocatechuate 3,4-dioxygenase beta subunit
MYKEVVHIVLRVTDTEATVLGVFTTADKAEAYTNTQPDHDQQHIYIETSVLDKGVC